MLRLHGVPLPGFALGTLTAILLLVTGPLHPFSDGILALVSVGTWLVSDAAAAGLVMRDGDPSTRARAETATTG